MHRALMSSVLMISMCLGLVGAAYASGDRSKWPKSCADAIDIVSSSLSENAKGQLREVPREQLAELRDSFGYQIRTAFGMGLGNGELVHSCATGGGVSNDADDASMVIVEAVWAAVQ